MGCIDPEADVDRQHVTGDGGESSGHHGEELGVCHVIQVGFDGQGCCGLWGGGGEFNKYIQSNPL